MDINASLIGMPQRINPRTQHLDKTMSKTDTVGTAPEKKTMLDEIRNKGFTNYVKDINEKKKEELRKKILGAMGLTEEILAKMSPKQRAIIEKAVNAEVNKRMTAEPQLDRINKNKLSLHPGLERQTGQVVNAKIDAVGVGLGPLLALQEIEQKARGEEPKKEKIAG